MRQLSLLTRTNKDDVLRKLAEDLSAAVLCLNVSILTRNEQTGSYHGSPNSEESVPRRMTFLDGTDPVIVELLAGKEWVQSEDGHGSSQHDAHREVRTAVFPISVQGGIDHVVAISAGTLSDGDMRMIKGYCRQTALALENLNMQASLKCKIDRLSSLVGMVDDLSAEQSYRNLLQTVLDRSSELLLAEQGSIMMVEKETDSLLLKASKRVFEEPEQQVRVPKGVGIAGKVAERGEPILVEDIEQDPRIGKKNHARYKTTSFLSVPLKIGSRVVGVMNFTDKASGEFFDDVDLQLAQTYASHAAVILDRKEISDETERLKQQAITDHLTGLLNRGCILSRLREELSRSERYGKVMSLVMLDIDGFKNINDLCGHAAGDRVLQRIAAVMTKAARSIDIVGRYGGDEFVIILPETDSFFAVHMAQRVRFDIAATDISQEVCGRVVKKLTASIGIATFPLHGTSCEVLVDHADEALYRAKTNGKDRVVVY